MGVPESLIINENVDLEGKVKILEKRLNKITKCQTTTF